ncbi:MAG TPA: methyltransferase domain-containing protein [Gemmatimonadaceae bacterium]|nr:methyltransferase domain-containing protein [Gemmatimonadaceae bacterium]
MSRSCVAHHVGAGLIRGGSLSYHEDPELPGYWLYDGLRIQADVEAHQFAVGFAQRTLSPRTVVLDIAAGEGALAKQLLDRDFSVVCTSWNDRVQLDAPRFSVNLDYPFDARDVGHRRYPLVCAIEIIEHVENPAEFLRSCERVLAPGGRVILSTPNVENAAARLQWLWRGHPRIFSDEQVQQNRHISMPWGCGLEYLIDRAGLRVEEKHLVGRPRFAHNGWLAAAKRALYASMAAVLPGDAHGTTRLYVLSRSADGRRASGPSEVF